MRTNNLIKGGFVILSRLKEKYINEVTSKLVEKFKYSNLMQVPKIEKVVINMGVGEAKDNSKVLESVVNDMQLISGQNQLYVELRSPYLILNLGKICLLGAKVTLRKSRMYDFIDKLFNVALPRVRDFRGVSEKVLMGEGIIL